MEILGINLPPKNHSYVFDSLLKQFQFKQFFNRPCLWKPLTKQNSLDRIKPAGKTWRWRSRSSRADFGSMLTYGSRRTVKPAVLLQTLEASWQKVDEDLWIQQCYCRLWKHVDIRSTRICATSSVMLVFF